MTEIDYLTLYSRIPEGLPTQYLRTPEGVELLGIGESKSVEGISAWRRLEHQGTAFFYLGFDPSTSSETWRAFGDARLVIPSLLFENTDTIHHFGPDSEDLLKQLMKPAAPATTRPVNIAITDESALYEQHVEEALRALQTSELLKVVIARRETFTLAAPVNVSETLREMNLRFPTCTTFAIRPKNATQTFIGVTPERLVRVQDHVAYTGALAGSAPRGTTTTSDEQHAQALCESLKDQEEHLFVRDMIYEALDPVSASVTVEATELLKLSNVQHLWTEIRAHLKDDIGLLDLVDRLHPTPAVGGLPKELAREEISRIEGFDRGLYAGVIGYFTPDGAGDAFVCIRSALVDGVKVEAYAGAGIVTDSVPKLEARETRIKFAAVLETLR